MRKHIIFRAEPKAEGWKDRKYAHTGSLTRTIAEHFDCSDKPLVQVGYRLPEFIRVEQFAKLAQEKTHHRKSDWEVVRVETYTPDIPMGEFDMIVICTCRYNPINAPLKPMPDRQVSIASFGGDQEAYDKWLESQKNKQPAEV